MFRTKLVGEKLKDAKESSRKEQKVEQNLHKFYQNNDPENSVNHSHQLMRNSTQEWPNKTKEFEGKSLGEIYLKDQKKILYKPTKIDELN